MRLAEGDCLSYLVNGRAIRKTEIETIMDLTFISTFLTKKFKFYFNLKFQKIK